MSITPHAAGLWSAGRAISPNRRRARVISFAGIKNEKSVRMWSIGVPPVGNVLSFNSLSSWHDPRAAAQVRFVIECYNKLIHLHKTLYVK